MALFILKHLKESAAGGGRNQTWYGRPGRVPALRDKTPMPRKENSYKAQAFWLLVVRNARGAGGHLAGCGLLQPSVIMPASGPGSGGVRT